MISEKWAVWEISLLSLVGIIYFLVMAFMNKFMKKDTLTQDAEDGSGPQFEYEDDERQVLAATGQEFMNLRSGFGNKKKQIKFQNIAVIDSIIEAANLYFLRQTIFMLPFAFGAWLIFYCSFSAKWSIGWSVLSLIYGLVAVTLIAFITLRFTIHSSVRFLNESLVSRGRAYSFGWVSGVAISSVILCILLFFINDIVPMAKYFVKQENLKDVDSMTGFFFSMMSFVWGILSGAIFYRQIGQEVGKGLISGSDMIGCDRKDHFFTVRTNSDELTQQGKMFGNIISQSLTNAVDLVSIISLLVITFSIVLVQSPEILALEEQSALYFPSHALICSIIIQIILSVIAFTKKGVNDYDQNMTPSTFTAKNNILQVILCNVLNIFVFIFVPLYFFPNTNFSIGKKEYPGFFYTDINSYNLVWCAETGLFTQAILLLISEYFTSNAFKPTKEVAQIQLKSSGQAMSQTGIVSAVAHGLTLLCLGFSIMLCYLFGGFVGIGCGLVGLLSTPCMILTNTIFGDLTFGGSILAKLENLPSDITRNVRNMAKGALNYQVYLQYINASAVFYVNIILIGLISYFTKSETIQIWETYTILGIFIGASVAYFLKASSTTQTVQVSRDVQGVESVSDNNYSDYNYTLPHNFRAYIFEKIAVVPMVRVIVHLVGCFILLLVLAYLFGSNTVIGYIIGLNLIGIHITLYSILVQNSTRNARLLNEEREASKENSERDQQGIQNSVECDIGVQNNENNSLLMYLLINTLFVMMGSMQYWSKWGKFGKSLNSNRNSITEATVSIWNWAVYGLSNEGEESGSNDGEAGAAQNDGEAA